MGMTRRQAIATSAGGWLALCVFVALLPFGMAPLVGAILLSLGVVVFGLIAEVKS